MNRKDFQQLANIRIREAKVLLDTNLYEGSYYLAGYSVECALKACIARQIRVHDFPDRKLVKDVFTHNLQTLIRLAGLETELRATEQSNSDFGDNWRVVKDWSEEVRYETNVEDQVAKDLYLAITHRRNGVLTWLKKYW